MKVVNEDRQSISMLEFLQRLMMLIEDQDVRRLVWTRRFSDTKNSFGVQTLTHQEKQYYEKSVELFLSTWTPAQSSPSLLYLFLKKAKLC